MEHHHVSWENPLQMAILNNFLDLYQRVTNDRKFPLIPKD
jgi:hypothetical protein